MNKMTPEELNVAIMEVSGIKMTRTGIGCSVLINGQTFTFDTYEQFIYSIPDSANDIKSCIEICSKMGTDKIASYNAFLFDIVAEDLGLIKPDLTEEEKSLIQFHIINANAYQRSLALYSTLLEQKVKNDTKRA